MKKKILVVEDDLGYCKLVTRQLQDAFDVIAVNNGKQALKALGQVRPDLMITDMEMPEMDGVNLVKSVRSCSTMRQLPIIMMSSQSIRVMKNRTTEMKLSGYFEKEGSTATLEQLSHKVLGAKVLTS